ncbi:hypothetical protein [Streptosporangium sp. NPDC051022]|uniref:hypothetical protein n=1 Tax=Streptosporangium sp. NPDC051022 TaxID=3155752 RepID=UPI003430BF09
MAPEFHLQMSGQRASQLRKEAAEYRRARQVQRSQSQPAGNDRSSGERRRGLFGKTTPA